MKTTKRDLAKKYVELKKQFDGDEFKAGIKMHDIDWLVQEFSATDLEDKITAVENAIYEKSKKAVRTKKMTFRGKEYTVELSQREYDDIKHEVRIAKLNVYSFDWLVRNGNLLISDWTEVVAEIWDEMGEIHAEVGMGATLNLWSDRRAMTVTRVITPKKIEVKQNETRCLDWYGSDYEILPELRDGAEVFTLRKNGTWVAEGQPKKYGSVTLTLGFRHHYIDPSF